MTAFGKDERLVDLPTGPAFYFADRDILEQRTSRLFSSLDKANEMVLTDLLSGLRPDGVVRAHSGPSGASGFSGAVPVGVARTDPPGGRDVGEWVRQAYRQAVGGTTVVCLLPARTDTRWWNEFVSRATAVWFLRGRVKACGGPLGPAPRAACVVVFGPLGRMGEEAWVDRHQLWLFPELARSPPPLPLDAACDAGEGGPGYENENEMLKMGTDAATGTGNNGMNGERMGHMNENSSGQVHVNNTAQGSKPSAEGGATKATPVHTVRIGSIKAAVWKNRTSTGFMFNATLVRLYRTQQGVWGESHSLSRDDLLTAAKALDLAHSYIVEAEAAARVQTPHNETP